MNLLTFPLPLFRQALGELLRRPQRVLHYPLGVNRSENRLELLVRPRAGEDARTLLVTVADDPFATPAWSADAQASLCIGRDRATGVAVGQVRGAGGAAVDWLKLVGPGMHTVRLGETGGRRDGAAVEPVGPSPERWSRTIGGLGGMDVWERLRRMRVSVIGLGRTGSILSQALARQGLPLTLIDPDRLELYNCGEMAVLDEVDCGLPKARALAAALAAQTRGAAPIVPVVESITRQRALHAVRATDFLVTAVDHDGARLAAAVIASLFHKPMIDVGVGIHGSGPRREMGADVRLLVPGRCLLCLGGLQAETEARQVLASADAELSFYRQRDWTRERAGSLASLNQLAAACALRLFEDFLAERIPESSWLHLEFDPAGRLSVSYPPASRAARPASCPVCRLAGMGEEGLPHVTEVLRQGPAHGAGAAGPTRQEMPTWLL